MTHGPLNVKLVTSFSRRAVLHTQCALRTAKHDHNGNTSI